MATSKGELPEENPVSAVLPADIQNAEQELSHRWRITLQFVETLQNPTDREDIIRHTLAATQSALQAYTEAFQELERLYATDSSYKDHATQTKTTFLEHSNLVNGAIVQATEKACSLALETVSNISRHSRVSSRSRGSSRISKAPSSSFSMKAQALASAAAAEESAAFEEIIAKRTTELVTQQAAQELERAKQEAQSKILQAQYDLEQQTTRAAADADLKILRAKQAAAIERARSNAILEVEQEENSTPPATNPE